MQVAIIYTMTPDSVIMDIMLHPTTLKIMAFLVATNYSITIWLTICLFLKYVSKKSLEKEIKTLKEILASKMYIQNEVKTIQDELNKSIDSLKDYFTSRFDSFHEEVTGIYKEILKINKRN